MAGVEWTGRLEAEGVAALPGTDTGLAAGIGGAGAEAGSGAVATAAETVVPDVVGFRPNRGCRTGVK